MTSESALQLLFLLLLLFQPLIIPLYLAPGGGGGGLQAYKSRSYKNQMGPVMGDAAHAVCVAIFQRIASSFECPRAWCVFYARPLAIVLMTHLQAVSPDSDVDTNKELVAHGYSNFWLAYHTWHSTQLSRLREHAVVRGMLPFFAQFANETRSGSIAWGVPRDHLALCWLVQLSRCYSLAQVRSRIFVSSTALAGKWLTRTRTTVVMVVSALIFVLGIDLVKEAL